MDQSLSYTSDCVGTAQTGRFQGAGFHGRLDGLGGCGPGWSNAFVRELTVETVHCGGWAVDIDKVVGGCFLWNWWASEIVELRKELWLKELGWKRTIEWIREKKD
jgi:hypothetical protein